MKNNKKKMQEELDALKTLKEDFEKLKLFLKTELDKRKKA